MQSQRFQMIKAAVVEDPLLDDDLSSSTSSLSAIPSRLPSTASLSQLNSSEPENYNPSRRTTRHSVALPSLPISQGPVSAWVKQSREGPPSEHNASSLSADPLPPLSDSIIERPKKEANRKKDKFAHVKIHVPPHIVSPKGNIQLDPKYQPRHVDTRKNVSWRPIHMIPLEYCVRSKLIYARAEMQQSRVLQSHIERIVVLPIILEQMKRSTMQKIALPPISVRPCKSL